MSMLKIRKTMVVVEEIHHEGGPVADTPLLRGAALAVVKNPYAGRYEPDIQPFMDDLRPLGLQLAERLAEALGGAEAIEGYGKASVVGEGGELEHGALWHAPGGYAMREVLGGAKAIVPSSKKLGGPGGRIDSMELGLNDAPRADEMLVALVMTTGPRIHARAGGLAASEIKGEDGLR